MRAYRHPAPTAADEHGFNGLVSNEARHISPALVSYLWPGGESQRVVIVSHQQLNMEVSATTTCPAPLTDSVQRCLFNTTGLLLQCKFDNNKSLL